MTDLMHDLKNKRRMCRERHDHRPDDRGRCNSDLGAPVLKLDWATHDSAKYACEHWHYSQCLPTGKLVKVGVWENDRFIGVILFGRGASPFLGKKYDLPQTQCVELVRIALRKHITPVSRMVSIALKFLKRSNPKLRLVVSFADTAQGHRGAIYQAGNWIYTGLSSETTEVFINGRWKHMRGAFYKMSDDTPTRTMPGKHRYVMPLDKEIRNLLTKFTVQYP